MPVTEKALAAKRMGAEREASALERSRARPICDAFSPGSIVY
jgi:hypothetical protein